MKPRFSNRRSRALTLVEVLVVVAVLAVLVAMLLPAFSAAKRRPRKGAWCVVNLKQIGLAYRIWAGDNGGKFPMAVSVTNGGSMEMVATGNVTQTFLLMSNELSTPKILHCPEDMAHTEINLFSGLASANISYFAAPDVTNDLDPRMLISGDANFTLGGAPVKSGLLEISSNAPLAWSATRHKFSGNVGFADGSVMSGNDVSLTNWLQQTGLATNRLAIP